MELSPQSKQQIDTILRFEKWTAWGFGVFVVSAIVGMLVYASYWDMPDSFILVLLMSVFALMLSIETTRFLMWRRFVTNETARKLLTLRYTVYLIGFSAIGYYGIVVFYETPQPQTFQAFLLSQAFFWAAAFFGRWLDRIIQKHDGHYLTGEDLKLIREAREIEQEREHG
ncbi:hypothetical protein [Exiguobacterium chiriqhucha]|uniref:hypothetical protein n=1 Tax=Exiguobacterium chiriqhucha TaxID=1385984 RepID=UPI0038BA606E